MKQWKHKCELKLLVCQPNPLRPDRVTVGYVLRDTNPDAPRVEVCFAKSLRTVRCIYPDADIEAIQGTLQEMESVLKNVTDVEQYLHNLPADFPADFALLPGSALLTDSIEAELPLLEKQYLVTPQRTRQEPEDEAEDAPPIGRPYLRRKMQEAFAAVGVSDLLATDIPISPYTFQGDLLKIDFGYRHTGSSYRMLHATSVVTGLDQTAMLAVRWPSIRKGFQSSVAQQCELLAIVEDSRFAESEQSRAARQWVSEAGIEVRPISTMEELALEARNTLRP